MDFIMLVIEALLYFLLSNNLYEDLSVYSFANSIRLLIKKDYEWRVLIFGEYLSFLADFTIKTFFEYI